MITTQSELRTLVEAELDLVAGGINGTLEGKCYASKPTSSGGLLPDDPVAVVPTYGLGVLGDLMRAYL